MRPSITTGAAVRTATALTAEVGAPEDATAAPSRMQASARVRANVGMDFPKSEHALDLGWAGISYYTTLK